MKILIADDNGICTPEIVPFKLFGNIISEYIVNFLKSPYINTLINSETYGVKMPRAGTDTMINILVPLPPFAEQKRIVTKIEELLPYIEAYEKAETQLTALNTSFPEMLKKSILQEAVQGKLIPQNPDDEPASVLLERIRAEKQELIKQGKIKKNKNESVIITRDKIHYEILNGNELCINDEVSFEIPESWEWVRLPHIAQSGLGKTLNKSIDIGETTPYLCSINVYWDGIDLTKLKTANFSIDDKEKYLLRKDDLLICEGGDVGRSAVWNNDTEMYYQNALHRVRFYCEINPYFYLNVLKLYKSLKILDECSKGVTIKHLVQGSLNSLYFPLPPLAEQKRIVDKINELMPIINSISK